MLRHDGRCVRVVVTDEIVHILRGQSGSRTRMRVSFMVVVLHMYPWTPLRHMAPSSLSPCNAIHPEIAIASQFVRSGSFVFFV